MQEEYEEEMREWSEYGVCKATRVGGKTDLVLVSIINISSGRIGIGRQIHLLEIERPTIGIHLSIAEISICRHYAILGLDRSRTKPYTDEEIKSAFRAKALEFHPDQNQHNKVAAEAKFKEVLTSYEAIKSERKNHSCLRMSSDPQ